MAGHASSASLNNFNIPLGYVNVYFRLTFYISIWLLLWTLRDNRDPSRRTDLWLLIIVLGGRSMLKRGRGVAIDLQPLLVGPVASGIFAFAIACVFLAFIRSAISSKSNGQKEFQSSFNARPAIYPCRTTHTRIFPAKHSFSYSYLQVSVPIDFEGRYGLVSVGSQTARSWFHIQASDHLQRGSSPPSLKEKLTAFLESQGVSSSEWHHAYLTTAPRFLGYSFNPVSFWYIYSEDRILDMMILEVNNTFDERRMYLLRNMEGQKSDDDDATVTPDKRTKSGRFRNAWAKDFHVSPFNSRKGYYTLSSMDPFADVGNAGSIDNTIVLKSSKNHAKLVARIFSEGPSVDPLKISPWSKTRFLTQWFWVGFSTFPRILKEAAVLFFKRKLHVWFRPEVLPTSIGRRPTSAEITLEAFFSKYLQDLVRKCGIHIQVTYHSGLPDSQESVFKSSWPASGGPAEQLEIKVLTPAFFSRFAHYAHSSEAFDRECVFTDEKNRTVWVSKPALLPVLLESTMLDYQQFKNYGPLDSTRWWVLKRLRCPPAVQSYPFPRQAGEGQDIRRMTYSPLDRFVRVRCPDAWVYQRQCIRFFLAERLAFGYPELIDFIDLSLRVVLIWFGVSTIIEWLAIPSMDVMDLLIVKRLMIAPLKVAQINSVHLWASLKG